MNRQRKNRGQCLIEMMLGGIAMVPVMLFGLDVITLGLSTSINDHLAKEAARAAANQQDPSKATRAAQMVIDRLHKSVILKDANLEGAVQYRVRDRVVVSTRLKVRVPAPFPFFEGADFVSTAVEPLVGDPVDYQDQTN